MVKTALRLSMISVVITLLSFASQLLTARTFGAHHAFDRYLFAISLPFLATGAAAGALSQAFVPRLLSVRPDPRSYQDSLAGLLLIALGAAVLLAFGGVWLTGWSNTMVSQAFTAADQTEVVAIARVAWRSAGLALLASALTAVHHAEKSFLLPALSGAYLYAGMIVSMVWLRSPGSPVVLAWGMLAGSLLSVLILLPRVLRCISLRSFAEPKFRSLLSDAGRVVLVILANCAFSGLAPVEAVLAPRFGPGALSYLGYAQRLIIAMGTVIVAGPSVLLVPEVAEAWIAKDRERVRTLAFRTIVAVGGIATMMALIFGLFRVSVITLLLQRGAFDVMTTRGVAATLPWMLAGSVPMLGTQMAFRVLYGQNQHATPAIVGLLVPGLYWIAGLSLSNKLGFQGICVAYAISWWVVFLLLLVKILARRTQARA